MIMGSLRRHKKGGRRLNPDSLDLVILRAKAKHILLKTGSNNEVARQLKISKYHVKTLLHGVELPEFSWRPAVDELLQKGYSQSELARQLCKRIPNCNFRTAVSWFRKNTPPLSIQEAIVKLNEELSALLPISWEFAVDELLQKGYPKKELARQLCQHIPDCKIATAQYWFAKSTTPPRAIQESIVKLNRKLPALVSSLDIPWESAVDGLLQKNYSVQELARKLCQRIPNYNVAVATAVCWFGKRGTPPLAIQEAIVRFNEELLTWVPILWESAIDELLQKGYPKSELAQQLCQRMPNCKIASAKGWFAKRSTPSLPIQETIIKLNKELPSLVSSLNILWESAVDELLQKNYSGRELARQLCQRIPGCNLGTAATWFAKRNTPSLPMQEAIVKLNEELPALSRKTLKPRSRGSTAWKSAVDNLLQKGYLKSVLARQLCQRISCNANYAAANWFTKSVEPPLLAQEAIVKLNEELPPLHKHRPNKTPKVRLRNPNNFEGAQQKIVKIVIEGMNKMSRSAAAKKAWKTRQANIQAMTVEEFKKLDAARSRTAKKAAKKAWITRRGGKTAKKRKLTKKERSAVARKAAKKAWATRRGGKKVAKRRKLTKQERSAIARKAAKKAWKTRRGT